MQYAGVGVRLVVCVEGDVDGISAYYDKEKIIVCALESSPQRLFLDKYGCFFQARGLMPKKIDSHASAYSFQYNYRYDAIRFSFKAFSYYRVIKELQLWTDFVGWIDSDVVCLQNFDLSLLGDVLPKSGQIASYLGRESFPYPIPYSECGFLAFDYRNSASRSFIVDFIAMYETGEIFLNSEWHDCVAFDVLRNRYEQQGHKFFNLAEGFGHEEHPFVKTKLGLFFDHLKGPVRKAQGYS